MDTNLLGCRITAAASLHSGRMQAGGCHGVTALQILICIIGFPKTRDVMRRIFGHIA